MSTDWTLNSLDESVRSNDAEGIQQSIDQLTRLEYSSTSEERDFKELILKAMDASGMKFQAPSDVRERGTATSMPLTSPIQAMDDIAEALKLAEIEEAGSAADSGDLVSIVQSP